MHTRVLFRRKTYILTAFMSIFVVLALLIDFYTYNKNQRNIAIEVGKEANAVISFQLDSILNQIIRNTHNIAGKIESRQFTQVELENFIRKEADNIKSVQGVTVAYEPFMFSDTTRLYAPYYDRSQNKFIDIAKVYNYTDTTLNTALWYTEVVKNLTPEWSEPYYAEGAQLLVSDYGCPIYLEVDDQKKILGTITLTISLQKLTSILNALSVGTSGYAVLISNSGEFLAHPESKFILSANILDVGKANNIEEKAQKILDEETGLIKYTSLYTHAESYMFFSTLASTEWKPLVILAADDLKGNAGEFGNKVVNLSLGCSFLIIMWLLVIIRINENTNTKLWILSTIFSGLTVLNIGIVWYLNINHDYSEEPSRSLRINSQTELSDFIKKENTKLINFGYDIYTPISTGIYVEGMEFKDSYNISVKGKIWQVWPNDLDKEFSPGFQFIQQSPSAKTMEKLVSVKKSQEINENLYLWEFSTTIRLPLRYTNFPFDSRNVNIELSYPDLQSNILLVPDLNGYTVLNPSAFPGIRSSIYFPQVTMKSSHFSFEHIDYHTQFGNADYKGDDQYPVMEFNINLKRRFINSFVTNIIPILVVASMIFLIFYGNSKNKDENTGISMMGVIQSCAGFFFVLLIAHIALRGRIASPDITYMETFYFTMYIMIAILAINIVAFTKVKKSEFLHYEDNLIVKLAYWPLLLGSWLVITLSHFYV